MRTPLLCVAISFASCVEPETPLADTTRGDETGEPAVEDSGGTVALWGSTSGADDTSPADDSDAAGDSDSAGDPTASRCTVDGQVLLCAHQSTTLTTGLTGLVPREVHWQVPLGEPPAGGWPAALVFQGSIFTAELFWAVIDTDVFGAWNQGLLTKQLLDSGFAVITPEAHLAGLTAWETNIPPMATLWETGADHQFMLDIFDAIDAGTFGPVDADRLYATGISSGGYMTSRMDEAYRDRFRALAIHSASWATCAGPLCVVPGDLDADHLPTMFLHGTSDAIVPISTMVVYRDALAAVGVETQTVVGEGVGHAWLDEAPTSIVDWFAAH